MEKMKTERDCIEIVRKITRLYDRDLITSAEAYRGMLDALLSADAVELVDD